MSLTQALGTAFSGLNAAQTGLSLVAGNVANAQTPGYVRETATLISTSAGAVGNGVQVASINRVLDQFVQTQLRTESAGAGYADMRSQMYDALQGVYGTPGATSTLESAYNSFTDSLQALTTSPDDGPTQTAVVNAAQQLVQQLNTTSDGIQALRGQAELGLSEDVTQANDALKQIAQLNQQLVGSQLNDSTTAALEDERDGYVDQLAKLMDIRVIKGGDNELSIQTSSGVQLVSASRAAVLSFNAQDVVSAQAQWSADPTKSGVGTITLTAPNGSTTDLVATKAVRSGEIAAYLEMRDQTLVQAQDQIDQFSAAIASALSQRKTDGTAASSGAQSGYDVDIGSLASAGDSISVGYTDTTSNQQKSFTFVRVDDPSALPLSNSATIDPKDTVVGIDFSAGTASVVSQINAALAGTGMTASNPSGTTLRVLDDGAANTVNVDSLSTSVAATSLTGGVELPLFVDETGAYTGAISGGGPQSLGFAGRIAVNQDLINDPTLLVKYQTGTAAADPTRPNFLYDQLANGSLDFAPTAGIGTTAAPYSGTATSYLSQIISLQSAAASSASNLKQGQDVVLSSLQKRFDDGAKVNIDQEMSNLLSLQNSYAANARVMTTVNSMLTALMQMGI